MNTLSTPESRTTAATGAGVVIESSAPRARSSLGRPRAPAQDGDLDGADHREERDPQERCGDDRGPQLLGPGDVVLVERRDDAAESLLDRASVLADDRADDARRGRDLERGEQ